MIRSIFLASAVVCAMFVTSLANATTLNVNLHLAYNDPGDMNSGGNWTLSALAGDYGLAGIVLNLLPANFSGDFLISNSIFEVQLFSPIGGGTGFEFVIGEDLATPTLNVGVGSAVDLVTGTFDIGDIPALTEIGANRFNAAGSVVSINGQNISTSLTSNLVPEPTTLALLSVALVGLTATTRRHSQR